MWYDIFLYYLSLSLLSLLFLFSLLSSSSLEDFLYLSKFSLTNLSISSILFPVSISNPKQYIAVTGSVSQKGEIQPIGGINEKIEGFFDVCKIKGFTGNQGVMMPIQNVKNLLLKDEVVEAVKQGKFDIYAMSL